MDIIQIMNLVCLLALTVIGFYCAYKMNESFPLWLRLFILSPSLIAFYKISEIFREGYIPIPSDIALRITGCILYALVASMLSTKPWIHIRRSSNAGKRS